MAVASDCSGGTAVCGADADGLYLSGDTAPGATQFTACDLRCDYTKGQTMDIDSTGFWDCEFHQVEWATIAQAVTARMYPNRLKTMGDTLLIGGFLKSEGKGMETDDAWGTDDNRVGSNDFEMRGPFSRADPDGSEGTSIHEDVKAYNIRALPCRPLKIFA